MHPAVVEVIVGYINECLKWLPISWSIVIIGFVGFWAADGLVGIISRAWRLLGR